MIVTAEQSYMLYPRETLEKLRACGTGEIAVTAIAGRDSVAATLKALHERPEIHTLLPTSIGTGTEFGKTDSLQEAVDFLRERISEEFPDRAIYVFDVERFASPKLWSALNARFATELREVFGMNSPCLACHLYLHIARVPLARAVNSTIIITGERDTHDGRIKLSQTIDSIDAEIRVVAQAGIELLAPVRASTGAEISLLVPGWHEGEKQLECVHSGNYKRLDGSVEYDQTTHVRYIREFYEPIGTAIIEGWLDSEDPYKVGDVDYLALASSCISKARAHRQPNPAGLSISPA